MIRAALLASALCLLGASQALSENACPILHYQIAASAAPIEDLEPEDGVPPECPDAMTPIYDGEGNAMCCPKGMEPQLLPGTGDACVYM